MFDTIDLYESKMLLLDAEQLSIIVADRSDGSLLF